MQTLHRVVAIQWISAPKATAKREKWLRNQKKGNKRQRIVLKRLVKQRKHLSLARSVSKTWRIISENGTPEIFSKNGRFSARRGGLESPQFILRTILVIIFHKLYQKHSERLSLRSSETKNHRHLNIKAFAFLNPCLKLIDVLIWITMKRIPQIPVNTCVRSNVRICTHKSLRERSPPSWIRTNPLLMPYITKAKSDKTRESPTYWGLKKLPMVIKPH